MTEHDVESAVEVDMGDYVVYNDWVGQVRSNGIAHSVSWHDSTMNIDRLSRSVLERPLVLIA